MTNRRPLLLDLFCGAGGAAMGYHRAGFDVIGVDIEPQPHYPFPFHQGDALAVVDLFRFDAIHASPPCQTRTPVSAYSNRVRRRELVNLTPQTRDLLASSGRPYVIENVPQEDLVDPIELCAQTFGLKMYRHRRFELSGFKVEPPAHQPHTTRVMRNGYLPTVDRPYMTITGRNGHHSIAWRIKAAEYMGTPWIESLNGVCEAIPPAYTEHIGRELIKHVRTLG